MDSCAYSARIMGPTHVENVVELAIRTALAYRQPTHVNMPVDIQSMPVDKAKRSKRNIAEHVSSLMARGGQLPVRTLLERAAPIPNILEGSRVGLERGSTCRSRRARYHNQNT